MLHDQEVDFPVIAFGLRPRAADVMESTDVGVVQGADRMRFTLETFAPVGHVGETGGKNFQGDGAIEPRIGRAVDLTHAALANEGDDFVRAQAGTGAERHPVRNIQAQQESSTPNLQLPTPKTSLVPLWVRNGRNGHVAADFTQLSRAHRFGSWRLEVGS